MKGPAQNRARALLVEENSPVDNDSWQSNWYGRFAPVRIFAIAAITCCALCAGPARAESAIFWVSGPVHPGDAVLATGYYSHPDELTLKVAKISGDGTNWQTKAEKAGIRVMPLKVSETSIMFVLPNIGGEGVYAFRVDQPGEAPVFARVNLPEVWWTLAESPSINPEIESRVTEDIATPGAVLRIFGRCLLTPGVSQDVRLTSPSGQTSRLQPKSGDSYEVIVTLPKDIAPGRYSLSVGLSPYAGGKASDPYPLQIQSGEEGRLAQLHLTDFGAHRTSGFDNTAALQSALSRAEALGGGVVRIPAGSFFFSQPIDIPPNVYLVGEGSQRTALYFPDIDPAPVAWIHGLHHFGVENIAVLCGNHNSIISSDLSGKPGASGHVRLRNVFIRGNSFRGHPSPELAGLRLAQIMKSSGIGEESVRLSGPDIIVEDCDIQGSSRSLYIYGGKGVLVRRNQLHNGAQGWYNFSVSDGIAIEGNSIRGEGSLSSGGSYATWGEPKSSKNIYTANNTYSQMFGWDREAITSDGGGGAYFGTVSRTDGGTLTLAGVPAWGKDDWAGALVAVIAGHGAGQWRMVASWSGQQVKLSHAFAITPDSASKITIVPMQLHYIFDHNHFRETGLAIQFYGTAVEHIVTQNDESMAGGYFFSAGRYAGGVAPQLNIQIIDNILDEGPNYQFGPNGALADGPSMIRATAMLPSAILGMVIRGNDLRGSAILRVQSQAAAGVSAVLVDSNHISAENGVQIDQAASGEVLVRRESVRTSSP